MRLIPMLALFLLACGPEPESATESPVEAQSQNRIPVIFDTDANNELDDQHALAYLVWNDETFDVRGITTNATVSGGEIALHDAEAERILKLTQREDIPLHRGANANFPEIRTTLDQSDYDGHAAVDFMIEQSRAVDSLVLLAVGKLTNVALAAAKDPTISERVRLVWLGSNYPEPGEYNQDGDPDALRYLLDSTNMPFEMVTVRYGQGTGTDAVTITQDEVNDLFPGKGPRIAQPITGRHGGEYATFGDYAVNLFQHIDYYSDPPKRALFDQAAVAVVKNPDWAQRRTLPAPQLRDTVWVERPDNARTILLYENFNREAIIGDFLETLERVSPSDDE